MKEARGTWATRLAEACGGDYARVLFLDESWAATNLVRLYGRSPEGERCVGRVPAGHWRVLTTLAAIRLGGVTAAVSLDGPVDALGFAVYAKDVLAPELRPGDVVVMDNLSSHKGVAVAAAIEAAGARVLYLPPYSPDYNPIEMIWSKVKGVLRTLAACTVETLGPAIGVALAAVTTDDIAGCFRHCGYSTPDRSML